MNLKYVSIILGIGLVLSLAINAWLVLNPANQSSTDNKTVAQTGNRESYELLSQRIFVEDPNDVFVGLMPLREATNKWMDGQKNKISLYFEYLPSGSSIGVNEKDEYPLASLFKLPVVMATILRIERGEESWSRELTLTADVMDRNFGSWWKREVGTKVTVREAVEAAIIESDNTAYNVLLNNLPDGYLSGVINNFDLATKEVGGVVYPAGSTKGYASIFRGLYLASFLNRSDSNDLLELLTRTKYNDKLPAGVAPGIKVAHKFGVLETDRPGETVYSDCGIVYIPKRPYILCVMAHGLEAETREQIKYISMMVYGYVNRANIRE